MLAFPLLLLQTVVLECKWKGVLVTKILNCLHTVIESHLLHIHIKMLIINHSLLSEFPHVLPAMSGAPIFTTCE